MCGRKKEILYNVPGSEGEILDISETRAKVYIGGGGKVDDGMVAGCPQTMRKGKPEEGERVSKGNGRQGGKIRQTPEVIVIRSGRALVNALKKEEAVNSSVFKGRKIMFNNLTMSPEKRCIIGKDWMMRDKGKCPRRGGTGPCGDGGVKQNSMYRHLWSTC